MAEEFRTEKQLLKRTDLLEAELKKKELTIAGSIDQISRFDKLTAAQATQIASLKKTVADLEAQIASLKEASKADDSGLRALVEQTQDSLAALQKKYNTLSAKMDGSYTAEELSQYFNRTIENFNTQLGSSNAAVQYIINSMDVDLKAQVVKNNGTLRFLCDPAASGENLVSTIKISIRTIPK